MGPPKCTCRLPIDVREAPCAHALQIANWARPADHTAYRDTCSCPVLGVESSGVQEWAAGRRLVMGARPWRHAPAAHLPAAARPRPPAKPDLLFWHPRALGEQSALNDFLTWIRPPAACRCHASQACCVPPWALRLAAAAAAEAEAAAAPAPALRCCSCPTCSTCCSSATSCCRSDGRSGQTCRWEPTAPLILTLHARPHACSRALFAPSTAALPLLPPRSCAGVQSPLPARVCGAGQLVRCPQGSPGGL